MPYSLGSTLLVLAIYLLASARITRLINLDAVSDPLRLAVARRVEAARAAADEGEYSGGKPALVESFRRRQRRWHTAYEFLQCPWCVGFWVALAGAVVVVAVLQWSWWWVLPIALAVSHAIGVLARFAEDEEIEAVQG